MRQMIWMEVRKLCVARAVQSAVGLLLLLVGFSYWQTARNIRVGLWAQELVAPAGSLAYTLAILATAGPLFALVIGAWSAGQEFRYRTWPELLTHGAGRGQLWLAKVLASLVTVLLSVLVALIVGYGASLWATGVFATPVLDAAVGAKLLVVASGLGLWAVVAFGAALAMRGTGAAIVAGFALPLLESLVWSSALRDWLPVWNQRAINAAVFGSEPLGMVTFFFHPEYPPLQQAVLALGCIFTLVLGLSYLLLRRAAWL